LIQLLHGKNEKSRERNPSHFYGGVTARRLSNAQRHPSPESPSQDVDIINELLDWMIKCFRFYLRRASDARQELEEQAEVAQSLLRTSLHEGGSVDALPPASLVITTCSAEMLIYESAIELARGAAVQEMNGNYVDAAKSYKNASRLFEQLTQEENVEQADLQTLKDCIRQMDARIATLRV